MSKAKQRDPDKERFWRQMLKRQQQSKLSIRAFCRLHQLSETNFYAWRRTLARRDRQLPPFVPVQLLNPQPPTPPPANSPLELLLPNGRILRIGPAFDADTLRRLLPLLEDSRP